MPPALSIALDRTIANLIAQLKSRQTPGGWWEGHLSSSALSTATAVSALSLNTTDDVTPGLNWLAETQNEDGGWGDTVLSRSNISTTLLCWCAFSIARANQRYIPTVDKAEAWLRREAGTLEPSRLVEAILKRYGNDRTFSVPILTVLAIAGKLGEGRDAWRDIPQLPFELAAFPHQLFGALRLPVVSYALPALIAIGQVRHHHRPSVNPLLSKWRDSLIHTTLRLLRNIQPSTGGYLEATPLTSFVLMSLAAAGRKEHPVVQEGVRFLRNSIREDGSWPIDTNLSTWVTTLTVNALSPLPADQHPFDAEWRQTIRDWLLKQQCREEHPYTHAAPGGWAWTPLPGGVPDADDTPGALLALRNLGPIDAKTKATATAGVRWLINLQNTDGGMPTFCRGWGKLPFDRSGADLTAHALSAWTAWLPDLDPETQSVTRKAVAKGQAYLQRTQNSDGSWTPLWFGNEHAPQDENPTYGTARTVLAFGPEGHASAPKPAASGNRIATVRARARFDKAIHWLLTAQNPDGGWGGAPNTPSSIEETSLAIQALCTTTANTASVDRGVQWLIQATNQGTQINPSPIGLYFARLWYFEDLYPLIFALGTLIKASIRQR